MREAAIRALIAALSAELANLPTTEADSAPPEDAEKLHAAVTALEALLVEATKTEGGQAFPSGDYAYVPDADAPSTWKLRLTSTPGGPPDPAIVGAAAAALGEGFRGNRVDIPADALAAVKAKVRGAWRKANPDKAVEDMPDSLKESAEGEVIAQEGAVALSEAAVKDGKSLIKVIDAGWGTSGFYSPAVLERDAPVAWPRGTKMFWDHPSVSETRPERSLRDLAAELTEDARWMPSGPEGPGVYSKARVFKAFAPAIDELAPHIGVSIRSSALIKPGEAEGRKGPIVEKLIPSPTNSIDFVTIPGRGGKVAALFEAARGANTHTEDNVNEQKAAEAVTDKVAEAVTRAEGERDAARQERDRAMLALALRDARDVATEALASVDIPSAAKTRLVESISKDPPMKDGLLDRETFKTAVEKAGADERQYIAALLGTGEVKGMGSGSGEAPKADAMEAAFRRMGLSEAAAKTAAAGRGN